MICVNECFVIKRDYDWFWILLPLVLLIVCLLYFLSRPNYARLTGRTYQLIHPRKNVISFHPQKQHNYAFDQYANYSTPTSSRFLFEQQKEKNNSSVYLDNTKHQIAHESNKNANNCNDTSMNLWNETRTFLSADYHDSIDSEGERRSQHELSSRNKGRPLLSNGILSSTNESFEESNSIPIDISLGRIWFSLEYNPYSRQLCLTIIKARHLRSITHCQPTTFVRAEILLRLNTTFYTDVVLKNANPDYMIETTFNINLVELRHNVLKLTVYEIDKEMIPRSIGTTYYPLDHLLIAQRTKGHVVWRNLLPGTEQSEIDFIQTRTTVWYDAKDECLNVYVHSLHATIIMEEVYHVYVHAAAFTHDLSVILEEHTESSEIVQSPFTHGRRGPIVSLEQSTDTIYDQLFRFMIYKHEFNDLTVVLDVYYHSLGGEYFDDVLLGRTVFVPPKTLTKRSESRPTNAVREILRKKKKRKKERFQNRER